jgi:uncharacterized protein YkwD
MPRTHHIFVTFAAFLLLLLAVPAAQSAPAAHSSTAFLQAVNGVRAQYGLHALRVDANLRRAAAAHSVDMLRHGYFAHGDFHDRMVAFHVWGPVAGEDLAWGTGSYGEAQTIVQEWLASPEHRANLLRPGFSRIGFGIVRGSFQGNGGATIVTADFAGS